MKRIYTYFLALIAGLSMLSCTREVISADNNGEIEEGLHLTVKTTDLSPTKADAGHTNQTEEKDGEDKYNENIINSVDYFLYNSNDLTTPVNYGRIDNVKYSNSYRVEIATDDAEVIALFGESGTKCEAYVIVNLPSSVTIEDMSLDGLKKLAFETSWHDENYGFVTPTNFVMAGQKTVTLLSRKKITVADDVVKVKRLASKITVDICIEPSIEVEKTTTAIDGKKQVRSVETWVPDLGDDYSGLLSYLNNASPKSTTSDDLYKLSDIRESIFDYALRTSIAVTEEQEYTRYEYETDSETGETTKKEVTNSYPFYQFDPFYTSPLEWDYSDPDAPFIKIVCPWKRTQTVTYTKTRDSKDDEWGEETSETVQNETQKNFYYKLTIPGTTFKKNNWYEYKVYLGLLGSDTDDTAVEVSYKYYVADWHSEIQKIETSILDSRYLSVEKDTVYLYNVESVNIPYVTSHDCKITGYEGKTTNVQHTHLDLTQSTPELSTEDIDSRYSITLDTLNKEKIIIFKKTLDNDEKSDYFDYTIDTTRFRICHADGNYGTIYYKDIVVIQYPAIYADYTLSNKRVFINEYSNYENQNNSAYNDAWRYIGALVSRSSVNGTGLNNNPNLYKLYVTVLNSEKLFIADPRVTTGSEVDNISSDKISKYRGARTDDAYQYAVAPSFMMASSCGKTDVIAYQRAYERCASYQEDGYPAGRWRLPTKGEIEFVVSLSNNGHIPTMFGARDQDTGELTGHYWCADGDWYDATTSNFYSTEGTHFVRCVYDLWYWGDDPVESAMTEAKWSDNL